MKTQILNSKGEAIVLNAQEQNIARHNQQIMNSLGYEIDMTTLTAISKRVVEQKFFTVRPSEFLPVRVGEGSWSSDILTYRDFSIAGDFETGIQNTGASNARLADADAGVDSITVPVINWAKQINYSLIDLNMAARSGNWDLITSKERARKKNWDLGIQKIAFLGSTDNANVKGLLTQADVTANTTLITEKLSTMTATEYTGFVAGVVAAYRGNSNFTAMPTHFIIPEDDYNGLVAPYSESFPNISKLSYLLEAFKTITQNPNFEVRPLAYANKAQNAEVSGLNKNRYTLLNYDEDSLRMDIPVDYTNTVQNSINGFTYQNVGYGQFTGVKAYRPKEVIYFDYA